MDKKRTFYKKILTLFFILNSLITFSQGIKIDLNIVWKKSINNLKCDRLSINDSIFIPYLKIRYKNESNNSYYFKNMICNNLNFSNIGIKLSSGKPNYEFIKISKINYENNYVVISNDNLNNEFMLYSDTVNKLLSKSNHNFAKLRDLFEIQSKLNFLKTNKKLKCFNYKNKKTIKANEINSILLKFKDSLSQLNENDFIEENIKNKFSNFFVFIKSNEVKEYEVNLISFLMIGGSYTFLIDNDVFNGKFSMLDYSNNDIKTKLITLPKLINGYKLYDGKLIYNQVDLNIKF